jgi:hypothetical protein
MIHRILHPFRHQREGQTLAVVAVMIVALLAMMSLAIDLGMAFTARSEAQRVADASALAGASVFLDTPEPPDLRAAADARARQYAGMNFVRNRPVEPTEDVDVWVDLADERVRVRIRRSGLPVWFARLIGQNELAVAALAAAQAQNAGATDCLKPWAVMDAWDPMQDAEMFDPTKHTYEPITEQCDMTGTGYGSGIRDAVRCDHGMQLTIKAQRPNQDYLPEPGVFLPLRLPTDNNVGECRYSGGGDSGASAYRNNICNCNSHAISIGDDVPLELGNMVGPTSQGVEELIRMDPTAYWNTTSHRVESDMGMSSPRVVKMALIRPDQIEKSGMQSVTIINFGKFFIEGIQGSGQNERVVGRFLYYVDGMDVGHGNETSPLVKVLRLVE